MAGGVLAALDQLATRGLHLGDRRVEVGAFGQLEPEVTDSAVYASELGLGGTLCCCARIRRLT